MKQVSVGDLCSLRKMELLDRKYDMLNAIFQHLGLPFSGVTKEQGSEVELPKLKWRERTLAQSKHR